MKSHYACQFFSLRKTLYAKLEISDSFHGKHKNSKCSLSVVGMIECTKIIIGKTIKFYHKLENELKPKVFWIP